MGAVGAAAAADVAAAASSTSTSYPPQTTFQWFTEVGFEPVDLRFDAAIFAGGCFLFVAFYFAFRGFCSTAKQRSYVMALLR